MAITQQVTSELSIKRVAAYFKQSHKDTAISVQRVEDEFLISDRFIAVKVPAHPDLFPYVHFEASWERASFAAKEMVSTEGGPDIARLWDIHCEDDIKQTLTMTHYLFEIAGVRNKSGKLHRKLTLSELNVQTRETLIDKKFCDLLSPDIDECEGFLFEQGEKDTPVLVSARNGRVALFMPMANKR